MPARIAFGAVMIFMSLITSVMVASLIVALDEGNMENIMGAAFFVMVLLSASVAIFLVATGRSSVLGQIIDGAFAAVIVGIIVAIVALVIAAIVALCLGDFPAAAALGFGAAWFALFLFVKMRNSGDGGDDGSGGDGE